VLVDNAIDGGQPQPRAFPHALGGKERIKDAPQILRRDAAAIIRDAQAHKPAGSRLRVRPPRRRLHFEFRDFNGQQAAFGHGVARVHRQVQKHLLHHAIVSLHQRRLRPIIQLQGDVFPEDAPQHLGHVADHFIHIQLPRLHHLPAAERQQLAGQGGGPLRSLADLLRRPRVNGGQPAVRHQQRGMAVNDRKDIVEIVGHAAGKLADGFHLLRLPQLFLQPFLRHHIPEYAQLQGRPSAQFHP